MSRLFELPSNFEGLLEQRLVTLDHSLKQPKKLAESIRKLSNVFLKGHHFGDYWQNRDFRAAYISYFAVLNFVRLRSVFEEARHRHFLDDARSIVDWGCGAGSATWALAAEFSSPAQNASGAAFPFRVQGVDQSVDALDEYQQWLKLMNIHGTIDCLPLSQISKITADTVLASYVFNEVETWPEIPEYVERLMIIEPSTHQAGRRLLEWRDEKLREGWSAWAPCTHQRDCPLLAQSGRDWCHHRIHWRKPSWFADLEEFLPMRNDTLTLTYLLLARKHSKEHLEGLARVVGDEQEEKGKTRQMVCRGPAREFLSWLHRDQVALKLKRGDILQIDKDRIEPRANEIRITIADSVRLYGHAEADRDPTTST